jgi:hypothetical protein
LTKLAVRDDGRTDPEHGPSRRIEAQGADCHIESGVTSGVDPPDRAAIGPARVALELGDQLHRADLGRPGDRAAGEDRADQVGSAQAFAQPSANGRGHLVDRRVALDGKGPLDSHAAGLGDAAEVVTHQVDDHQVLGAVLDAFDERGGRIGVAHLVEIARARAFHRLGGDRALVERDEQLGREAQQPVRAVGHHPTVSGPRLRADRRVERQRIAAPAPRKRQGQVGLVDVAGDDRLAEPGERGQISADRQLRLERADLRPSTRRGVGGEPFGHRVGGDFLPSCERAEPDQRPARAGSRRGERSEPRLERQAGFVGDVSGKGTALFRQRLDPRQRGRHVLRSPRHDDFERIAIEPWRARALAARVVEQNEGGDHPWGL